jgi:hypothetical protein
MPSYDFLNKNTNEIEEHRMSYTKLDEFKAANPHLERYFAVEDLPIMSDGSRLSVPGIGRPDSTFQKYVIDRMKHGVAGNRLSETHKTKIPREW